MHLIVIGVAAFMCLYMAFNIGANDFANSMGDAVGSRAISIRPALIIGALCELAGAVLVGTYVSNTLRKGIIPLDTLEKSLSEAGMDRWEIAAIFSLGMICALLGASLWLHLATKFSMPASTTHAVVGAVTGFGVISAGWAVVNWGQIAAIVLSWIISPLAGAIIAFVVFRLFARLILGQRTPVKSAIRYAPGIVFVLALVILLSVLYKGHVVEAIAGRFGLEPGTKLDIIMGGTVIFLSLVFAMLAKILISKDLQEVSESRLTEQFRRVERIFGPLVIISSCGVAFAHGANDVANAVGPLAGVVDVFMSAAEIEGAEGLQAIMSDFVPFWVLTLGGFGIVIGAVTYGYKVLQTVGFNITELTPTRGVAADLAAASTVLLFSRLGVPISTSHTLVGAICGIGLARGLAGVNAKILGHIFMVWAITVPATAIISVIIFLIARGANVHIFFVEVLQNAASAI